MMVLPAIACCSGEPPARRRRRTSAREQKGNKPRPTGPHWTNQTHRYRAQNDSRRAQQHGSELWSPVRDEEAAGSNPVTPTSVPAGQRPPPELVRASVAVSTAAKYSSRATHPVCEVPVPAWPSGSGRFAVSGSSSGSCATPTSIGTRQLWPVPRRRGLVARWFRLVLSWS